MWREARIAFTDSVAALNCTVIPAHPWIYGLGQQTENGAYLSPVNAITYMVDKLAGMGGTADIVIMMVAGQTHSSFMDGLNQLADVFPLPAFVQVKRLAQSAVELAAEKMQIPAKYSPELGAAIPLSVPTNRMALAAAAVKKAQEEAAAAVDMDELKKQLTEFAQLRDGVLGDIASGLEELQGKSAKAWVFTARGDLTATLLELVKGIPLQSSVYTAAMMLIGDNLDGIKGMIHDIDTDSGA
ncbi:hypothetical protein [Enterobacter sp. KBR-315C3_2022]|uniref:hypothetical protein n=1 Tax=Enterobacter sp. KBR-315C3_2022 TaxID=3242494 RepID=UPI0035278746